MNFNFSIFEHVQTDLPSGDAIFGLTALLKDTTLLRNMVYIYTYSVLLNGSNSRNWNTILLRWKINYYENLKCRYKWIGINNAKFTVWLFIIIIVPQQIWWCRWCWWWQGYYESDCEITSISQNNMTPYPPPPFWGLMGG